MRDPVVYLFVAVAAARPRSGVAVTLQLATDDAPRRERHLDELVETTTVRNLYAEGIARGLEALTLRVEVEAFILYDVASDFMHGLRGITAELVSRIERAKGSAGGGSLFGGGHTMYFRPMTEPKEEPAEGPSLELEYYRVWLRARALVAGDLDLGDG